MKYIKVALIAPEYKHINGGAGIYARTLYSILRKNRKIRVDLYSCNEKISFFSSLKFMIKLQRRLKNKNYDIIHNTSFLHFSDLLVNCRAKRIVTLHSTANSQLRGILKSLLESGKLTFFELQYLMSYPILKILELLYAKKVDMVLSVGKKTLVSHNKTIIIDNAVSLPDYKKDYYPWLRKKRYCLFVGRHLCQKGIDILIDVCRRTKYFLVTAGNYDNKLRKMLEREQIRNFYCAGFVGRKRLHYLYDNCEIIVLPSYNENSPLVCYEAMIVKKPLLCFDVGNIRQIMKNKCVIAENKTDFISRLNNFYKKPFSIDYGYSQKKSLSDFGRNIEKAYFEVLNEDINS